MEQELFVFLRVDPPLIRFRAEWGRGRSQEEKQNKKRGKILGVHVKLCTMLVACKHLGHFLKCLKLHLEARRGGFLEHLIATKVAN